MGDRLQVGKLYDTIGEFNVHSKAEYSALSSTRSQKKKLKQTTPVPLTSHLRELSLPFLGYVNRVLGLDRACSPVLGGR